MVGTSTSANPRPRPVDVPSRSTRRWCRCFASISARCWHDWRSVLAMLGTSWCSVRPMGHRFIQSASTKRFDGRCFATGCLHFHCMVCGTPGRRSLCRWMSTRESFKSAWGIRTSQSRCRPTRMCCRSCTTPPQQPSPHSSCPTADPVHVDSPISRSGPRKWIARGVHSRAGR